MNARPGLVAAHKDVEEKDWPPPSVKVHSTSRAAVTAVANNSVNPERTYRPWGRGRLTIVVNAIARPAAADLVA
jgi:hypothetical protein